MTLNVVVGTGFGLCTVIAGCLFVLWFAAEQHIHNLEAHVNNLSLIVTGWLDEELETLEPIALDLGAQDRGIERWVNVAGTSAGAIIASLLAVGYKPGELRKILEATDYAQFADYGWGGKWIGGARNARNACTDAP